MNDRFSLDPLWAAAGPAADLFRADALAALPEAAKRYLARAIRPGARLASAVRLTMRGEIKLGKWRPFTAEEVLHRERGFIWAASVRMNGLPVRGADRLVDGEAELRWKMLGLIPLVRAAGPDIVRSATGRWLAEWCWLPSAFVSADAQWETVDAARVRARLPAGELVLAVAGDGRLESVSLRRWGNPEGGAFREVDFGALAEEEGTFAGFTIPVRLRAGWHFGGERFAREGEFFRCVIERAEFR
jgi:hypothetical protein